MRVNKKFTSDTELVLTVTADEPTLHPIKEHVLTHLKKHVKVPGFREGKVPPAMVEKNINQAALQEEFLKEALNHLYAQAIRSEKLRPVSNPDVTIRKFVPFSMLEFEAKVPVVGKVTLPDYKKIKKTKKAVAVSQKDIDEVLKSLRLRLAEKKDVNRAAKNGDQVWIDFSGKNDKGEAVKGADGKDYPLRLGSNTFIPGFENELLGLKPGEEKTFEIKFPKEYGVKALSAKKVTFTVQVTKVQEVDLPEPTDAFATKAGPFKSIKELEVDIKKQLTLERQQQVARDFESELIMEVASKSEVAIPQVMVDEQADRVLKEHRQNLTYRGQTYPEFLEAEGTTDEKFRKEVLEPQARERVKAGLVLSEVAERENIDVTPEELDIRMQVLKNQYQDKAMQAELAKPETRRDIASRILTEKTVNKLASYATNHK
jgi:trigger factor